jgi:hypothetical protein
MQKGFDTFKKETGRSMTYGEMRDMYGWGKFITPDYLLYIIYFY